MTVYHHLAHALRIMRAQPDYRRWGELIDKLPEEAREECRAWLRTEARKRQLWSRHERTDAKAG